jgi:VanZ family protein
LQQRSVPPPHLPLYLAAAYTLLVIYASLYPFTGWHDNGVSPTDFLFAIWPRYWTSFDLVTNILAYMPLGFIWVPALQPRYGRLLSVLLATLLGCCLSLSLETLQNFLPTRVASNLDLASNCLGVLLGALIGTRWGAELLDGGRLHTLSKRLIGDGPMANSGLVLLALWLLTQLNPEIILFGNGDLRDVLATLLTTEPLPYSAEHFPWLEAGVTASNTLAVGLICTCLLRERRLQLAVALFITALLVKSFSLTILVSNIDLTWMTFGSLVGLGGGLLLWLIISFLPRLLQQALAALALMLATTLVNLVPENPYLAATLQVWQQGHFLNFNGLTRLTSALWPFLALPWLMLLRQNAPEKS